VNKNSTANASYNKHVPSKKRSEVLEHRGRVVEVNTGPVITQFGVEPDYLTGRNNKKQRVKVSAIAALDKDLQLALGAKSIPCRSTCTR
jgi:hypothetical protein